MEIIELKPQGFCKGVIKALKIVNDALINPDIPRPIHILGPIIHNRKIINDLTDKGIITIFEKGKTRLELLDSINSGTVIFSAHGVSPQVYDESIKKGLHIIDASCEHVLKIHQLIKEKINNNFAIIYIGVSNHPESEGVLGYSNQINFIENEFDIENLRINNNRIYIANQTTLGYYELNNLYNLLKSKYPNAIIENGICQATTLRQNAILKQKKVDLCIIIGDKLSSNTKKLYCISKDICKINTLLIEGVEDLKSIDFKGIKTVSISAGASTPRYLVTEVIDYLKKGF